MVSASGTAERSKISTFGSRPICSSAEATDVEAPKNKGPAMRVDHHVASALAALVNGARVFGISLIEMDQRNATFHRDELGHAVHEEEAAEHHPDDYTFAQVAEHGDQEGRQKDDSAPARAPEDSDEFVPLGHVGCDDGEHGRQGGERDIGGKGRGDQYEDQEEERVQHAGDGSNGTGADVGGGAGDGAGSHDAAEEPGCDVCDPLRDELAVGAVTRGRSCRRRRPQIGATRYRRAPPR